MFEIDLKDLTCKEAAKVLRLSESTVKRLCDSGQLSVIRTPGGHRRILSQSVYDWILAQGSSLSDLSGLFRVTTDTQLTSESLLQQLLADDWKNAFSKIDSHRMNGSLPDLFDNLIGPLTLEVETLRKQQKFGVDQEMTINNRLREYLVYLSDQIPMNRESPQRAIGSAPENDPSDIASKCVELCLREIGWYAVSFGANLPAIEIAAAARLHRASLVWITYTHPLSEAEIRTANRNLRSLLTPQMRLMIGGNVLTAQIRRQLDFDFAGDSMNHLSRYASRLNQTVSV